MHGAAVAQITDQGYARVPNGTGNFIIQTPTFSANNNLVSIAENIAQVSGITAFPNPASDKIWIRVTGVPSAEIELNDALGRLILKREVEGETVLETSDLPSGIYTIRVQDHVKKVIVTH